MSATTHSGLTPAQLQAYQKDGFTVVPEVFSAQEINALNAEITRLRKTQNKDDHNSHCFLYDLGLRSPITARMCEEPRILDLVASVVKPGIAIYSAKLKEKPAMDPGICHWHQDESYYNDNSTSSCRMSAWIPLQDCTLENGCVWMLPGSHKKGLLPYTYQEKDFCQRAYKHGTEEIPGALPVFAKAGSVVLFHGLTLHRSLANKAAVSRRAFIISYQDALAAAGNGKQHKVLRPA